MTVHETVATPDPTREVIDECKRETHIRYKSKGNTFFRARLRGVNSIQVGTGELFPRHPELPPGHRDSRLVGRVVLPEIAATGRRFTTCTSSSGAAPTGSPGGKSPRAARMLTAPSHCLFRCAQRADWPCAR